MPRTRCRGRRCPELVDEPGFCAKCRPEQARETTRRRERKPWQTYHGDWPALANLTLAEEPMCTCPGCGPKCCRGRARSVDADHVIERQDGGTDVRANTRGRCRSCHRSKTMKVAKARREGGRDAAIAEARRYE